MSASAVVANGELTTESPADTFIVSEQTRKILATIVGMPQPVDPDHSRKGTKTLFMVTSPVEITGPGQEDRKHSVEVYVANGSRQDVLRKLSEGLEGLKR